MIMKVLIITGGIGSGKSSACRFLEKTFGWPVYSADSRVKELYVTSPGLLDRIEAELGRKFRDDKGLFVPQALASIIFFEPDALEKVESLVFPELTRDFEKWKADRIGCSHVILESATILEKPSLRHLGDVTILIDAPVDVRLSRTIARDCVTEEHVRRRMDKQPLMNAISDGRIKAEVDYVVLNDSCEAKLHERLTKIAEKLL